VFGVDLDGVVVDFYGKLREIASEWLGVPIEELTEEVTWGPA
jgi:deoxypyrimidine-specific 5' nucleotidase type C protein (NT5C)